ncbi:MAG: CehA/McbA family metallohydrolase [Planctomycetes bacterium]|nr:CehA/McbA family metallohydrolase [Planctomycetota bacterium]
MSKLGDIIVVWTLQKKRWPLLINVAIPFVVGAVQIIQGITFNEAVLHPLSGTVCGLLIMTSGGLYLCIATDQRKLRWSLSIPMIVVGLVSLLVGAISFQPVRHPSDKLAVLIVPFFPVGESSDAASKITHRIEEELRQRQQDGAPLIVMRFKTEVTGKTLDERHENAAAIGRARDINAQVVLWGEVRVNEPNDIQVFAYAIVVDPIVPSESDPSETSITSGSLEESSIFSPCKFNENIYSLSLLLAGLAHYKNGDRKEAWEFFGNVDLGLELEKLVSDLDPHRTLTSIQEPRIPGPLQEASPAIAESKFILFGVPHAHSKLSDDVRADDTLMPIRAFQYAHRSGLDFLAITDHHNAIDSNRRLAMEENEYKTLLFDVAMQFNASHNGEFIAIPGIEWGTIATGNHINVFGAAELPPDSILTAEYDELFAWAASNAEFVQFNHPNSWGVRSNRNKSVGNFGEALYSSTKEFVDAIDPVVKTVSVITSVTGGHLTGLFAQSENKTHRDASEQNLATYRRYLNLGLHVSPAANQDTHSANWGSVTAARTAVLTDNPTYQSLMQAIKENRVYATEDDELAILFRVRVNGNTYWMGDTVPVKEGESEIELSVRIWQTMGSDGDTVNEGPYTIFLYYDYDGIGGSEASLKDTYYDIESHVETVLPVTISPNEYIYLRVTEQNGKDNPIGATVWMSSTIPQVLLVLTAFEMT